MSVKTMRSITIGPVSAALIVPEMLIDWRIAEVGNRWRLVLSWRTPAYLPLSVRIGKRPGPRVFRLGPLHGSWYGKGAEG